MVDIILLFLLEHIYCLTRSSRLLFLLPIAIFRTRLWVMRVQEGLVAPTSSLALTHLLIPNLLWYA